MTKEVLEMIKNADKTVKEIKDNVLKNVTEKTWEDYKNIWDLVLGRYILYPYDEKYYIDGYDLASETLKMLLGLDGFTYEAKHYMNSMGSQQTKYYFVISRDKIIDYASKEEDEVKLILK